MKQDPCDTYDDPYADEDLKRIQPTDLVGLLSDLHTYSAENLVKRLSYISKVALQFYPKDQHKGVS